MLVKEQSEKSRFIKEVEEEMRNYYALLIEIKDGSRKGEGSGGGGGSGSGSGSNNGSGVGGSEDSISIGLSNSSTNNNNTRPPTCPPTTNRIVSDDGFDNCYNFIKEVVITTSKYFSVAITLLMNCTISYDKQDKGSIYVDDYKCLIDLFVNVLYERVSETDPFLKEITKLVCALVGRLPGLGEGEIGGLGEREG